MMDASEPLKLRPFAVEDAAFVAPWLCGPGLSVPAGNAAWPERLVRDRRIVALVAHSDTDPVGLVRLDCAPDGVAEITLVVAPEHRRRGHGRRMLEAALERARAVGMRRLVAYLDLSNEPAFSFFEGEGFESQGVTGDRIRMDRLVHAGGKLAPIDVEG